MEKQMIIPSAEPFLFTAGKTGCVLVHGFTGAPKEMRLMGEALYKKGISVLGVRLAGHATNPEDLERQAWTDWLASVEDGIDMLSDISDKLFIAGLSLGGVLTLLAAARYPELSGAIAMSAPYTMGDDWRINLARPLSYIVPQVKKGNGQTREAAVANGHVDYPAYPLRSIAELNDLIKVMQQSLPEIKIPVLLINSLGDQTVTVWNAERIEEKITSADVERLVVENSGHVVTEGVDREEVFEAAFQFIKAHGG